MIQFLTTHVHELSKLSIVEHCNTSGARPIFSIKKQGGYQRWKWFIIILVLYNPPILQWSGICVGFCLMLHPTCFSGPPFQIERIVGDSVCFGNAIWNAFGTREIWLTYTCKNSLISSTRGPRVNIKSDSGAFRFRQPHLLAFWLCICLRLSTLFEFVDPYAIHPTAHAIGVCEDGTFCTNAHKEYPARLWQVLVPLLPSNWCDSIGHDVWLFANALQLIF